MAGMTLSDARTECERWLQHLDDQERKTERLQHIAGLRSSGEMDYREAQRAMREIDGPGVTVYDGANMQKAVKTLLSHMKETS